MFVTSQVFISMHSFQVLTVSALDRFNAFLPASDKAVWTVASREADVVQEGTRIVFHQIITTDLAGATIAVFRGLAALHS